jgi:hypothetical protein
MTDNLINMLKDAKRSDWSSVVEILVCLADIEHSIIRRTLLTLEFLLLVSLSKSIGERLRDRYAVSLDVVEFTKGETIEISRRFMSLCTRFLNPEEGMIVSPIPYLEFVESMISIEFDAHNVEHKSIMVEFQKFSTDCVLQLIGPISNGSLHYQWRLRVMIIKLLGWLGRFDEVKDGVLRCLSRSLQAGLFDEEQFPDLLDLVVENCKFPSIEMNLIAQKTLQWMDICFFCTFS